MMKKRKSFWAKPALLFSASAVLRVMSTAGSTRAALQYTSDAYELQVSVSSIGVSLLEGEGDQAKVVSHRDYAGTDWSGTGESGQLLDEEVVACHVGVAGIHSPEHCCTTRSESP